MYVIILYRYKERGPMKRLAGVLLENLQRHLKIILKRLTNVQENISYYSPCANEK